MATVRRAIPQLEIRRQLIPHLLSPPADHLKDFRRRLPRRSQALIVVIRPRQKFPNIADDLIIVHISIIHYFFAAPSIALWAWPPREEDHER